MKKLISYYTATCFVLSISVVLGLWGLSEDFRDRPGSFLRQYPPHPVIESKRLPLDDDHYYFAGATNNDMYLASWVRPFELLKIASTLSDSTRIRLRIDALAGTRFVSISVAIDSPYFYLMDGAIPYIYRGLIGEWQGTKLMRKDTYFIDAIPIGTNSFAVRALSSKTRGYALGKLNTEENRPLKLNPNLLEPQFDGVFDVDGVLSYHKESNRLVYSYYYRNQYIVMDTSMHLLYRGNTIDTFKTARIEVTEIPSANSRRLSSPPYTINKTHAIYKNWLFVVSMVPAMNDDMERFRKASVIDVYDLRSRRYQFSFRIYNDNNEKLQHILVVNDTLFALFKNSIMKFDIAVQYFKDTIRIDRNESPNT